MADTVCAHAHKEAIHCRHMHAPCPACASCREVLNIIPVTHGTCTGVDAAAVGLQASSDAAGAKVGYVRVITFNANTSLAVAQAIREIKVGVYMFHVMVCICVCARDGRVLLAG